MNSRAICEVYPWDEAEFARSVLMHLLSPGRSFTSRWATVTNMSEHVHRAEDVPGGPHAVWDVIVIGAGPTGENVAAYATRDSGLTALLIESELVGGECSYWA